MYSCLMSTSRANAFAKPRMPPRPLMVLLAHTDIVDFTSTGTLLAHEDIRRPRFLSPRYHPYIRQQTSPLSEPELSEDDSLSNNVQPRSPSPTAGLAEQQARRIRIPRPKGAGRHPLHDLLKWDTGRLDGVKVRSRFRWMTCAPLNVW
jgi:hypothetical protein